MRTAFPTPSHSYYLQIDHNWGSSGHFFHGHLSSVSNLENTDPKRDVEAQLCSWSTSDVAMGSLYGEDVFVEEFDWLTLLHPTLDETQNPQGTC